MKITFFSNYYNHHQKAMCEALYRLTQGAFSFIATEELSNERISLGWRNETAPFEVHIADTSDLNIYDADVAIFGAAPRSVLNTRLKTKKNTYFYAERIYKQGYQNWKWPARVARFWWRYGRHKQLYLLCASGYAAADYAKHFTFQNKAYKWGYFPETKRYDLDLLMAQKKHKKILWCGRFLHWKHPDDAIIVAKRLRQEGYDFELEFIGTGKMESLLRSRIRDLNLDDCVRLLGPMDTVEVRSHMEKAGIYLFTSDFQEGWGAVLNESMNSGCAVVASHAIGSVPYLLRHEDNGLVYKSGDLDDLYKKVKYLLDNPQEQLRLGRQAYHTIVDLWNAEIATERFLKLTEQIQKHGSCDLYEEGPCSRAPIISNNWFKP